jgi:hypothetical protein
MKQEIYIGKSGGGTVDFDIELAPYLTDVISQVESVLQPDKPVREGDKPFFDTEAIRKDLSGKEGVIVKKLVNPTPNRLSGSLSFESVNKLLQNVKEDSPGSRMIRYETKGNRSVLRVDINRNTVIPLLDENPAFNNPLVENFGPATTEGLSDKDYLDMMEFALGTESRKGIQESVLTLTVRVEGRILEQKGGRLLDSSTVVYRVPLLSILMLNQSLEYSITYE